MTEVLDQLRYEVSRFKRELEAAATELASSIAWEAGERPGSSDHIFAQLQVTNTRLLCWELECKLRAAVASLAATEAKAAHQQTSGLHRSNPTDAELRERHERLVTLLEKAKRTAEEMVAQATDLQAANRRLDEQARQREDGEQRRQRHGRERGR